MLEIPIRYRLFSAEESGALDSYSINKLGIPGQTLMEVAGAKASDYILGNHDMPSRAIVLCGKGNNAGDALVATRHLTRNGLTALIFFISGIEALSEETQKNLDILITISKIKQTGTIQIFSSWDEVSAAKFNADFIIDGLLGTGLNTDLRGEYTKAVTWANEASLPIYSMDIPTGLHADNGKILGTAVKSTETFAFGTLKTGYYLESGPEYCGKIHFCDLGFPDSLKSESARFLIRPEWVGAYPLPDKNPRHKYEAGILYVIAGSEGLTGAAVMASWSAWAEGLGAVIAIVPGGLEASFEVHLIQQVKKPVGSSDDKFFHEKHANEVLEIMKERPGTILLGPGLGRNEQTVDFVRMLLEHKPQRMVIDADALWCIAQLDAIPQHDGCEWILTPHPGELNRLLKYDIENDLDRLNKVERYANKNNLFVVSKGNPVIVADPHHHCYLTDYDTTIFSRSGYGDVLSGKIGAASAMDQDTTISCLSALLKGKEKYDQIFNLESGHPPEPLDLI